MYFAHSDQSSLRATYPLSARPSRPEVSCPSHHAVVRTTHIDLWDLNYLASYHARPFANITS